MVCSIHANELTENSENKLVHFTQVFLVPYLPCASLLINILMMTQLTFMTWIRLIVWMAIGLFLLSILKICFICDTWPNFNTNVDTENIEAI